MLPSPAVFNAGIPYLNPVTHSLHNCIGRPHNTNDGRCQQRPFPKIHHLIL
jgi:hypothetical protein